MNAVTRHTTMYTNHPHNVLLLSSRFQYPDRRLFFTRARLFFDRIELTGWHLGKKHERAIAIDDVSEIEWDTRSSAAILHLTDGEPVHLRLSHLDSWQYSLEQRLHWNATNYVRRPVSKTDSTARYDGSLTDLITFSTSMG